MGVPNGIYIFMLAYLVIGFTGVIDLLGLGSLANGAHLGGLIGGVVTGGLAGLLARQGQARPS
jgi:GlpG protein